MAKLVGVRIQVDAYEDLIRKLYSYLRSERRMSINVRCITHRLSMIVATKPFVHTISFKLP